MGLIADFIDGPRREVADHVGEDQDERRNGG